MRSSRLGALWNAAGAAEINVNYDWQADFTRYKTWRWRKGTPAPDPIEDKRLRDAIESRLAARGLSRVDSRGDLEVSTTSPPRPRSACR
jgi:hypothetical protein